MLAQVSPTARKHSKSIIFYYNLIFSSNEQFWIKICCVNCVTAETQYHRICFARLIDKSHRSNTVTAYTHTHASVYANKNELLKLLIDNGAVSQHLSVQNFVTVSNYLKIEFDTEMVNVDVPKWWIYCMKNDLRLTWLPFVCFSHNRKLILQSFKRKDLLRNTEDVLLSNVSLGGGEVETQVQPLEKANYSFDT